MKPQIKRIHYKILTILFIVCESIFLFLYGRQDNKSYKDMLSHGLIFALIFILFLIILYKNEQRLIRNDTKIVYLYIGVMASVVLSMMSGMYPLYHLWIAGCMLLAMSYSVYLGILCMVMVLCIDSICQSYSTEQFVYYGVLGVILCLLFDFLPVRKEKSKHITSYICFIIIGLSCNVSLYLVANGLNYTLLAEREFIITISYTFAMITVIYIVSLFNKRKTHDDIIIDYPVEDVKNLVEDAEGEDISSSLRNMLSSEYELYARIKNEKPQLLKHSSVVADISKKAAKEIGADVLLATVGGLYHEAGKLLEGDDYIENNKIIADEYGFEDKITNILMSHNLKKDNPRSKEAAIVYFTDSIINTIYYFKNIKKDTSHTSEQIIDSFFEKRISDDKLYGCGLTLGEYGILKKFYIDIFKKRVD